MGAQNVMVAVHVGFLVAFFAWLREYRDLNGAYEKGLVGVNDLLMEIEERVVDDLKGRLDPIVRAQSNVSAVFDASGTPYSKVGDATLSEGYRTTLTEFVRGRVGVLLVYQRIADAREEWSKALTKFSRTLTVCVFVELFFAAITFVFTDILGRKDSDWLTWVGLLALCVQLVALGIQWWRAHAFQNTLVEQKQKHASR